MSGYYTTPPGIEPIEPIEPTVPGHGVEPPIEPIEPIEPTPVPGRQPPASTIPGKRELWQIDGKLYLIWQVPVDSDGDGEFDDFFPIAFLADPEDLKNAGISSTPTRTLTGEQWDAMGGLELGNMRSLNNTDDDPFKYFVDEITRRAELYPWLVDPEIMAITAGAWLMGRAVEEDDLVQTSWWQEHTAGERSWLMLAATDPASAEELLRDNRLMVIDLLEKAGIQGIPEGLDEILADRFTRGEWSSEYLTDQIELLGDPTAVGEVDPIITEFLTTGQVTMSTEFARSLVGNRVTVRTLLEDAGVNNAPAELVELLANKITRGEWTDPYLRNQIALLADPAKEGEIDPIITEFLTTGKVDLDTTQGRRDRVQNLVHEWLGPAYGAWSDAQVDEWAGKLRNDPDAEQVLVELLQGQRLALFPTYKDPNVSYQDIAGPWRTVVQQTWGEIADETDPFFARIVAMNDAPSAREALLREGLKRGVRQVSEDAIRDLYNSMGGSMVRRIQ